MLSLLAVVMVGVAVVPPLVILLYVLGIGTGKKEVK
jgi:hypothetical protein